MKRTYNTPETTLVKTIGNLDLMGFADGSAFNPAEPAPARKSGKTGILYV